MTQLADGPSRANGAPHTDDDQRDSAPPRSWSQYKTYGDCAKRWWLSKIRRVPRRPGVWLAAGTAVHAVIERYLREQISK